MKEGEDRKEAEFTGNYNIFTHIHRHSAFYRLRNDLYCVEWDVKLYYTIPQPYISVQKYRLVYHLLSYASFC